MPAPVTFLQMATHVEHLNGTFAFDKTYCFRYRILRWYRQAAVPEIVVRSFVGRRGDSSVLNRTDPPGHPDMVLARDKRNLRKLRAGLGSACNLGVANKAAEQTTKSTNPFPRLARQTPTKDKAEGQALNGIEWSQSGDLAAEKARKKGE